MLDLTRRVVATLGLDVELVATPELERTNRRDQLGAFLDAVADYVDVDGDEAPPMQVSALTASIGAAVYPEAGRDLDVLLAAADGALYAAKNAGRNRVLVSHGPTPPPPAAPPPGPSVPSPRPGA